MKTLKVLVPAEELGADRGWGAGQDDQAAGRSGGDLDEGDTRNEDMRKVTITKARRAVTGD